eukprot:1339661-Pleurochrysis_carterae.AAC.2
MRDAPDTRVRPQPFVRGQACLVPAARGACGTCEARSSCPYTSRQGPLHPSTCPTSLPPCLSGPMRA